MVYRLLTISSILGGNGCKSFLLKNLIVLVSLVLSVSLRALCPLRCSRLRMLFLRKRKRKNISQSSWGDVAGYGEGSAGEKASNHEAGGREGRVHDSKKKFKG